MSAFKAYVPNLLSMSRIPLAALFLITFSSRETTHFWVSICLIGLALLTDILDGRLARHWGVTSVSGYLLDGLGDKVFYAALLIVITREAPSQTLIAWLLIGRELILYGLRVIDPRQREHRMFLRSASLFYAFAIRIYFLGFLVRSAMHLYGFRIPGIEYFGIMALPAIVVGYVQIASLANIIANNFECGDDDRDGLHNG
jgi:phosphatidylglycerophosphate synthase